MNAGQKDAQTLESTIDRIGALLDAEGAAGDQLEALVIGYGSYRGTPPEVSLLDDGRSLNLLKPISYRQESEREWPVPAGAWCDGASIPRIFWSLIGGPLEGKYRNASIVHDHYCITKDRPWADVHRMFYDAMRCSGVRRATAGVMYYAVYRFGPRWLDPSGDTVEDVTATPDVHSADPEAILRDVEAIVSNDPGPDEIEALARRPYRGRMS